jgi:hypothetical protein
MLTEEEIDKLTEEKLAEIELDRKIDEMCESLKTSETNQVGG